MYGVYIYIYLMVMYIMYSYIMLSYTSRGTNGWASSDRGLVIGPSGNVMGQLPIKPGVVAWEIPKKLRFEYVDSWENLGNY